MTAEQRAAQIRAICIRFRDRAREGALADECGTAYDDSREDRLTWAAEILGEPVWSLTTLRDWQLNALRDLLEGKRPKVLVRLDEELAAAQRAARAPIRDPAAWFATVCASLGADPRYGFLRGAKLDRLSLRVAVWLCALLEARRQHRCRAAAGPFREFSEDELLLEEIP